MPGLCGIVDTGISYFDEPDKFILVIIIVTLFNDHAVVPCKTHSGESGALWRNVFCLHQEQLYSHNQNSNAKDLTEVLHKSVQRKKEYYK